MSVSNESHSLAPTQSNSLTKIDTFFDKAEHIVERTERLLKKSKSLFLDLAPFLFLIYELVKITITLIGSNHDPPQ